MLMVGCQSSASCRLAAIFGAAYQNARLTSDCSLPAYELPPGRSVYKDEVVCDQVFDNDRSMVLEDDLA